MGVHGVQSFRLGYLQDQVFDSVEPGLFGGTLFGGTLFGGTLFGALPAIRPVCESLALFLPDSSRIASASSSLASTSAQGRSPLMREEGHRGRCRCARGSSALSKCFATLKTIGNALSGFGKRTDFSGDDHREEDDDNERWPRFSK
jgi:hypothetical protein